jgi:hypothetical protein
MTFGREFGSWAQARAEAGLSPAVGQVATRGRETDYSRERLAELLREAAEELGAGGRLNADRYSAWRQRRLGVSNGTPVFLPVAQTISKRFGSWADALYAAGLLSGSEFARRRLRAAPARSEAELIAALAEAVRARGSALTRVGYELWREEQLSRDHPPVGGLPSLTAIDRHFGSWRAALRTARAAVA